jgi:hypothetical protein
LYGLVRVDLPLLNRVMFSICDAVTYTWTRPISGGNAILATALNPGSAATLPLERCSGGGAYPELVEWVSPNL